MNRLCMIAAVLLFTLSPFVTARSQQANASLLISRTSSEQWQIQIIAGTEPRRFNGVLESSAAFASVSPFNTESADSASLSSPTVLSANFEVWPGGSDGMRFAVPADAKLCLRDTGSSGIQAFLGVSLQDATPVSFPVAITGADACGDSVPPAPAATARKFNTGHYIAMMRGSDAHSAMQSVIKPGVVGVMKRYTWRELEPALGTYDFSEIQSDLQWAAAYGMRLVVMIEDKTFVDERPTPEYLNQYTLRNRPGGYTVVRWSPYVVARFKALISALGQRFDANPWLEGIATQESAPGFDDATLNANGYSPEKYRDALIDVLTSASVSLPKSRVFWFMNFIPRNQNYIASVANAVASRGVVMGAPDVLPDDHALQLRTYPFYRQFESKMPLFGQVEPACYSHPHESGSYATNYWTMPELFRYARDQLHVNYMFWVRLPKPTKSGGYDWLDALPVISANPTFNH